MPHAQPDLFGPPAQAAPNPEFVKLTRERLRETLALVAAAEIMPWPDHMTTAMQEHAFRRALALLPPDEAAALWHDFDAHLDRLYAVMAALDEARASAHA